MTENQLFEKKRKEQIDFLTDKINALLPGILERYAFSKNNPSDFKSQQLSLNAKIGGKHTTYMNVTDDVITSADEFASLWFQGMMNHIQTVDKGREETRAAYKFQQLLASDLDLLNYTVLFLKRTYLRNYYSLSKRRPKKEEAELWIGQRNANYGILITPRFKNGKWENDVSEIRHFQPDYWTIGHIMKTGFVIPHMPEKIEFSSIEQYLLFFKATPHKRAGQAWVGATETNSHRARLGCLPEATQIRPTSRACPPDRGLPEQTSYSAFRSAFVNLGIAFF